MTVQYRYTRGEILDAALIMARGGLSCVTLRGVARTVGIDHRNVSFYFGKLEQLRDAIAAEAITRKDTVVIARLIVDKHPAVAHLPGAVRVRYLASLA